MTTSRSRPFAWYRVAILLLVAAMALVTFLAARGPLWFQRLYHPLQYSSEIAAASKRYGVDPYLLASVMKVESGFDADIVSHMGAVGLMQLLPSTAAELHDQPKLGLPVASDTALRDPRTNTMFGAAYLGQLLGEFQDTRTALAAYNAGPNNVEKWLHRPGGKKITYADVAFPETKRYVKKVLFEAYYYRRLYPEEFK